MFYFESPRGVVALKNFEHFARIRLKFLLRVLKCGNQIDDFMSILSDQDVVIDSDVLLEGSHKDIISHFTLRLLLANEADTCDFLLQAETRLFQFRLKSMNDTELSGYLSYFESKLKKLQDSIHPLSSDFSFVYQIQSILSQIKSSHRSWRKVVSFSHDKKDNFSFHVPFSVVPQLVAKRVVTIQHGQADVPYCYLHDVLEHCFMLILRHGLQKCKSMQGSLDKRCRILRHQLQVILRNNYKPFADMSFVTSSSLGQQEVMSESKFFPPCMSVLFQNLHENHRLQHHSRIQLTLFLKEIGMPVHEALHFWRYYYSRVSDPNSGCSHKWEGNERRYQYSIRHLYGLEGSHINYRAHCCISLQEFIPSCGSRGGCPFKHFDDAKLIHFLSEEEIKSMEDILDLRGQEQFSNACALYLQRKTENILQSQILTDSSSVNEPSAKRARLESVTSNIKGPDSSSCINPGESEEKQVTTEKSLSSSCTGCGFNSSPSTKSIQNKRTEQSSADSVSRPFEANSKIPIHIGTVDTRKITDECDRKTKHLPCDSIQNQRKVPFSRKIESTLDVNSKNNNNSKQNTTNDKETALCFCHDLCLSQIANEEQLSKDHRKETKPIIKPSEFYVNFKNFCKYSRTALCRSNCELLLPLPWLKLKVAMSSLTGCRRMLQQHSVLLRFTQKSVRTFSSGVLRSINGNNSHHLISFSASHQKINHLKPTASFHCHSICRLYSNSSSNTPQKPQNEQGSKANPEEDPKETPNTSQDSMTAADTAVKKLSVFQRFKQTYKEHGKVLIIVEVLTSIFWYGLFYIIVRCGVDVISLLEKLGLSETMMKPFHSSGLGDYLLAFLLYKLISPIRYAVTLGGTGYIIRLMRKRGKIPQVTESTKLRTLVKDSKEEIKDKSSKFRERRRSSIKARGRRKRNQKCITAMSTNRRPNGRASGPPTGSRSGPEGKSKQIKLVLLGESGVGKSSIALRFVRGEFNENGEATIGAAYLTKTINVLQSATVKFDIWDTAGQERYHSLAPMYYRGAPAAVVVYDITSQTSFSRAQAWVKELIQQANSQIVIALVGNKADMASENRVISKEVSFKEAQRWTREIIDFGGSCNYIMLLGNKCDLADDCRDVPYEEGSEFASSNGLMFMEVSAKTGMNVEEVFNNLATKIASQSTPETKSTTVRPTTVEGTGKSGCPC
ncbi:uncharacterized protein LOC133196137 [Saccostrea echinata]|uniref:uncharacterized protein LOC133196137 n=1 Tax=Saccostrea echinata TaxID=191078 RepID=UPI002A805DC6|nr:uncharacterized protein LOC133196137 [Saccostrea echinata]